MWSNNTVQHQLYYWISLDLWTGFSKSNETASTSYNAAKHLFMLFFLGFNKCRKAGQASGRCSNLRTTFFTATGVTHPLSSTRSSLYRPGNNELNQYRVSVLSLPLTHTHQLNCSAKKKKNNMNNLQPEFTTWPAFCPQSTLPLKRVKRRWVTRVPFLLTQDDSLNRNMNYGHPVLGSVLHLPGGGRSRNRSLQSGCEMENTITVRADKRLSSNDPNVIVIPLKATISGQLQRLLVLN